MQWSRLFPVSGLAVVIVCVAVPVPAQDYGQEYADPATAEGVVQHEQLDYREALEPGMMPTLLQVDGAASWDVVTAGVPGYDGLRPTFAPEVQALAGIQVGTVGFDIPLDSSDPRLFFSLNSASCPFCLPGGPETMVEVKAPKAINAGLEPIMLEGTVKLIDDGVRTGFCCCRLPDARRVS